MNDIFVLMEDAAGTGLLDSTTVGLLTSGVADVKETVKQIIGIIVPAALSVALLARGAMYAIRKVAGLLSWA